MAWLDSCLSLSEVKKHKDLCVIINQYKCIVKVLVMTNELYQELQKLEITDLEKLSSIKKNLDNVFEILCKNYGKELKEELKKKKQNKYEFYERDDVIYLHLKRETSKKTKCYILNLVMWKVIGLVFAFHRMKNTPQ